VEWSALGLWLLSLPAAAAPDAPTVQANIGARKIFVLLFLMLGPIKILAPFVDLTEGTDPVFRRRLASRAVLFAAAALALAGLIGRNILSNFEIPIPVLALTGGLVLFLVALQTVMQQYSGPALHRADRAPPHLSLAVSPLAYPIVVTPYGIAAIIVFVALAGDDAVLKATIAGVVLFILLLDWLAMVYAHAILKWAGAVLQVFAVVLGVTQIALGLQVIIMSLGMMGIIAQPH
jgi:multiple antibiotic resistance protein